MVSLYPVKRERETIYYQKKKSLYFNPVTGKVIRYHPNLLYFFQHQR